MTPKKKDPLRVKVVYRKNLKMSVGKIAAQVTHAVIGLGVTGPLCTIVVLGVSNAKFNSLISGREGTYVHADSGLTEVNAGEQTCAAWIEDKMTVDLAAQEDQA